MFPFLRRNTPASPAAAGAGVEEPPPPSEPEVLEVHQGWTDPIVQAVRGVGLPSGQLPHTGDVVGYVETRPTERFAAAATASSSIATHTPPTNPQPPTASMYLARAPPPQKQSSGWLSYVFGTAVPGLSPTKAESGTDEDEKPPLTSEAEKHRPSLATTTTTTGGESGVVPGSFPVSGGGHTEKGTIRTEATVRETEKRRSKDADKGRKDEEASLRGGGAASELVRGGGRLGTTPTTADPVITAKSGNQIPAIVRPSMHVLPSTYVKSSTPAVLPTIHKPIGTVSKSYINTSTKPAFQFQQPYPTTFAATLASPPVITGTPAYGLSSARGKDGLTEAERVRKEWVDAQKAASKARRREEKRATAAAMRMRVERPDGEGQSGGLVRDDEALEGRHTPAVGGGGETVSRHYANIVAPGVQKEPIGAPAPGAEERPRRKKKIRNRDEGKVVAEGEGIEEVETGIKRIIIPQPLIVPSTGTSGPPATAAHSKRLIEQPEQARRVKRSQQSRRPAEEAGQQGTSSARPNGDADDRNVSSNGVNRPGPGGAVHRRHSHLRDRGGGRETRTTNLLRQASMRRRNVWDDLGDLSAGERAPPPAFGAAAGAGGRGLPGASPLANEVVREGERGEAGSNGRTMTNVTGAPTTVNGDDLPMHPDMDPNDPPPPFPETEEPRSQDGGNDGRALVPPRSPPPSFEFAVAQFRVQTTTTERPRRASASSSTSSSSSMIEYGPPTEMQSRVIEEREAWERDISKGFSLEERLERVAQRTKLFEREDQDTPGPVAISEPVSGAAGESTKHETSIGGGEPIPRFSKEEKGKGKVLAEAVLAAKWTDATRAAAELKAVETPQEKPSGKPVPVVHMQNNEAMPKELEGKPSRSYIKQSSMRHSESRDQLSPVKNDLDRTYSKAEPLVSDAPAPVVLASPVSMAERPLPALPQVQQPSRSPQPLFSRKPSAGRETNPWKLLRKMSSAGATPSATDQTSSSPLQLPSALFQRRASDVSGTDSISLSRTRSNVDERPKPSKRPSALSRMTSQLFKPNLGIDAGSSQADSGSIDKQNGQEVDKSPRIDDSAEPEEVLAESPVAEIPTMRYNDPPPGSTAQQGPPKPYIAQKHPFNRAVKPAWMQSNQPIWQDPRAVIINGENAPKNAAPSEPIAQAPTTIPPVQAPVSDEHPPVGGHKEVSIGQGRPTVPSRLPPPPPVPIRNPLPSRRSVEGLPPPRLASKLDEEASTTDIDSTASDISGSDTDSGSESTSTLSLSSSSTSVSEVMAKRRVSTYRLLPPRGIPAEVLRSSEPPPPSRLKERRERPRPNGPRARDEPPPLPPRPSAPTIHEEPAEEEAETEQVEPSVVRPAPTLQRNLSSKVSPPTFPPRLVEPSPPVGAQRALPEPATVNVTDRPANAQIAKPAPPPVPPRKPHVRKPSNGKASVQSPVEPVKEATLQERIMASLLPEAPSHERAIPRELQDSIRASILPGGATDAPVQRTRPAAYRSLMSGTATPQTAPVFQTAQPKRKKTANLTGKLNIKPRFDDRPELELKSQLALRVNRWRMKETPWTREEIEEELRRMDAQLEEDWPSQKFERTQSSPEIATKGMDSVRVGSGRIRDGQMRITSASTIEPKERKATTQPAPQVAPESPTPPAAVLQAPLESPKSPAETKPSTTAPASPGLSVSQPVNGQVSTQRSAAEPSQRSPSTRPRTQISPTIEYTDLDLAAARLEGTADEFEKSSHDGPPRRGKQSSNSQLLAYEC
ncbi:hypothetical protein QFC21_006443 [Naganishia friedmannii]|uniref:Uncharacterized protein n=1 Tax=Naganishia friedmannii TaxID=89922 RepID=A0ACC2V2E3_9TREE|nr:hypothetical protein QFC21_006443 [Naganishia friedmannii]